MSAELGKVTVFCFAASYALAFAAELARQFSPRPWLRWLALGAAAAGLVAHTAYVLVNPLPLQTAFGSLIFLAWVLAVFAVYGAIHHSRLAWGLFVLPLVLGLIGLARLFAEGPGAAGAQPGSQSSWELLSLEGRQFWPLLHGGLMLLTAVGVSVGFVASVMYLVQVHRLKMKQLPGRGPKLWSLERLEQMNRRAIILAFPLLTIGLLLAAVQTAQLPDGAAGLENLKVVSTVALWVVFAILLYLRYAARTGGRQAALLTIVAFALMLFALVAVHPFAPGGAE
jgi:ABC-type transport system involved in cytochrome c biogenesis permease subunit